MISKFVAIHSYNLSVRTLNRKGASVNLHCRHQHYDREALHAAVRNEVQGLGKLQVNTLLRLLLSWLVTLESQEIQARNAIAARYFKFPLLPKKSPIHVQLYKTSPTQTGI